MTFGPQDVPRMSNSKKAELLDILQDAEEYYRELDRPDFKPTEETKQKIQKAIDESFVHENSGDWINLDDILQEAYKDSKPNDYRRLFLNQFVEDSNAHFRRNRKPGRLSQGHGRRCECDAPEARPSAPAVQAGDDGTKPGPSGWPGEERCNDPA